MLNKLMKYELKATSRLLIPLYLILFFMSIINRFVFKMANDGGVVGFISQFIAVIYLITIFIVLIVTVFYMIIRFYKNLLTDEGYLMFTLPAKPHQLVLSKLLITVFWTIISTIIILISLFIAFATPNTLPDILNGVKAAIANFNRDFGGNGILLFIEFIIMFLLGITANILLIYLSIAVGQLFSKHKIIGSFAAYMIIYTIIQFLLLMIFIPMGVLMPKEALQLSTVPKVFFPTIIAILVLGSSSFYYATNYIFKRKLNLD